MRDRYEIDRDVIRQQYRAYITALGYQCLVGRAIQTKFVWFNDWLRLKGAREVQLGAFREIELEVISEFR